MSHRFVPGPVRRFRKRLRGLDEIWRLRRLDDIETRLDLAQQALGRIEVRQLAALPGPLEQHEFKVYSHAGEDGIIQYLLGVVDVADRRFVEFGVEDYREANTRFLLVHDHWAGLVMDGDSANVLRIQADPLFWNSGLVAKAAFVTRENVNELLEEEGFAGEIGLLSIDVDGNDYWILDAITVTRPVILVVEYNHRFGPDRSVTIPYDPAFVRRQTDWSWLFAGASLSAMAKAAARLGMSLVGCNSFGNNAFFVRTELLPTGLPALTASQGFVSGRFREAITVDGRQIVPTPTDERQLLAKANLLEIP